MGKIERLSRALRLAFRLILVLIPLFSLAFWWFFDDFRRLGAVDMLHGVSLGGLNVPAPLPLSGKVLGFVVSAIPTGIDMAVIYLLSRLFGLYAQGEIFSAANVRYIKKIGYTLLLGQALSPVYQALVTTALTFHNPPGQRYIRIGLSSADVSTVTTALVVIVAAWIMDEARKLQDEQALVI
ncbi:MAG: DUF2975 domain-containing protein [Pseudomonadota bacterium]